MDDELQQAADAAVYNTVYSIYLKGALSQNHHTREQATLRLVKYLEGASKNELVNLVCDLLDQVFAAQVANLPKGDES